MTKRINTENKYNSVPGVSRITDNILQISVPQMLGRNANVYLIIDDKLTLIDSGHSHNRSITFLKDALAHIGYSFKDISQIIYTHPHVDHVGGGLHLTDFKNIHHIACQGTAEHFKDFPRFCAEIGKEVKKLFATHCDEPSLFKKDETLDFFSKFVNPYGGSKIDIDHFVADKETITTGKGKLKVIRTPSHTPWDISLYEQNKKILFTGDFIAANGISLLGNTIKSDVKDYLDSLLKVQHIAVDLILPGHGNLVDDPDELFLRSINYVLAKERDILKILQKGEKTACQIAESFLRGKSQEYIIIFRYLGMVVTHLMKLEKEGKVKKTVSEKYHYYSRTMTGRE